MNSRREFFKQAGCLALVPTIAIPTGLEIEQVISEAIPEATVESFRSPRSLEPSELFIAVRTPEGKIISARGYATRMTVHFNKNLTEAGYDHGTEPIVVFSEPAVEIEMSMYVQEGVIENIMGPGGKAPEPLPYLDPADKDENLRKVRLSKMNRGMEHDILRLR